MLPADSPPAMTVVDYRCTARPGDKAFVEHHAAYSISYVRSGSFGYTSRGKSFGLGAGGWVIGRPGEDYVCTHDHAYGGPCLAFRPGPDLVDAVGDQPPLW